MTTGQNLVALNVGNSRAHIGCFADGALVDSHRVPNDDLAKIIEHVREGWSKIGEITGASIVLASVHDDLAAQLQSAVKDQLHQDTYVAGDDLPVPIGQQLDPETITGVDRLLNAAAAFDELKQACIVVDAGTAVTVDFVDGEGVFQGGSIAPGANMQLQAMHHATDALPDLSFVKPDDEAFGRSTSQAMLRGVYHGIRGMVYKLVETYSESYGAYPLVIATGGDAVTLFDGDDLIDRIVPELTLLGMAVATRYALAPDNSTTEHD